MISCETIKRVKHKFPDGAVQVCTNILQNNL